MSAPHTPIVYSARYHIDIGPHVFPTRKYQMVHARLAQSGADLQFIEPASASWDDLALVHTPEYLARIRGGSLSSEELDQLQLPWSVEMVEGFRLMVGGTIEAAKTVVRPRSPTPGPQSPAPSPQPPIAVHIGGGLHHAFPNHGEGFCPFNDVAVAVRVLQSAGVERVAIIDLDVHHGNGTAFIFNPRGAPHGDEADPGVFTFSMHQQHNYPMWKPRGSLDVGLPDGTADAGYLRELRATLPTVLASRPECVFYLAGADPFEDDQLGGLRLTKEGLRERDRLVIDAVRQVGAPLVVVLAGGYARRVGDTVDIHVATIEEALR